MAIANAQKQITETVTGWQNVTAGPHRFGGVEYQLGKREIGHIHGDTLVDIPFPTAVRDEIVAAGEASPHHILPDSGWISLPIRKPNDVDQAIRLLHRSYRLAQEQAARRRPEQKAQHDIE